MATIIFLPQRFQLSNGLSPVGAGIRMLPLLLLSAFGAGLGGAICSRKNVSFWILMGSLALQVLGLGLMSSLPISEAIAARQYVYQCILGLGFGLSLSSLALVARFEVKAVDHGKSINPLSSYCRQCKAANNHYQPSPWEQSPKSAFSAALSASLFVKQSYPATSKTSSSTSSILTNSPPSSALPSK